MEYGVWIVQLRIHDDVVVESMLIGLVMRSEVNVENVASVREGVSGMSSITGAAATYTCIYTAAMLAAAASDHLLIIIIMTQPR